MSLIADQHLTNPRANRSNWRTDPFHRWAFTVDRAGAL
jgi:hypothetical protein